MSEEKKIVIDEDWKAQVEREKAAAAADHDDAPEPPAPAGGGGAESPPQAPRHSARGSGLEGRDADGSDGAQDADPPMPPASFGMLLSSLATEAMLSLGQFPHPATGKFETRRNQAKYLIDTLAMLKEKTAGNLSPDEAHSLEEVLHQLRMTFVATK